MRIYYYHTDHLGSIRAVMDADGEVVWRSDYKAIAGGKDGTKDVLYDYDLSGNVICETDLGTGEVRSYAWVAGRHLSRVDGVIKQYLEDKNETQADNKVPPSFLNQGIY